MNIPPNDDERRRPRIYVYPPLEVLMLMALAAEGAEAAQQKLEFEFDPVASLGEALLAHFTPSEGPSDVPQVRRVDGHPFISRSVRRIGGYLRPASDFDTDMEATTDVSEGKLPVPHAEVVLIGRSATGPFRLALGAIRVEDGGGDARHWVIQALAIDNDIHEYGPADRERTQRGWELLFQNADPRLSERHSRLTIGTLVTTDEGNVFTTKEGVQLNENVLGADWRAMLGVVATASDLQWAPVTITDGEVGFYSSYGSVDWDTL